MAGAGGDLHVVVYVYVMERRMRLWVHADPIPPLLTREFLLAQRLGEVTEPLTRRTRMKSVQTAWKPKLRPEWDLDIEKTANCQSGVFICHASPKGQVLLDSRLYLPECWSKAQWALRREECRIPTEVKFQTKGLLNWQNTRMAEGEKGPLVAGIARIRVCLNAERTPGSERWLVLPDDPKKTPRH